MYCKCKCTTTVDQEVKFLNHSSPEEPTWDSRRSGRTILEERKIFISMQIRIQIHHFRLKYIRNPNRGNFITFFSQILFTECCLLHFYWRLLCSRISINLSSKSIHSTEPWKLWIYYNFFTLMGAIFRSGSRSAFWKRIKIRI